MANIDKIKSLCREKGISQAYICRQLGLRRTYFNDVKLGRSPLTDDRLKKIAEILNVSVDYLNDKTEEKKPFEIMLPRDTSDILLKAVESISPVDERLNILLDIFNSMSEEDQDNFLNFMRSLVKKQNKEK